MATITWTGNIDDAWDVAGNWDLARVPAFGDAVVVGAPIGGGSQLAAGPASDVTVTSLTITDQCGATLLNLLKVTTTTLTIAKSGAVVGVAYATDTIITGDEAGVYGGTFGTIQCGGPGSPITVFMSDALATLSLGAAVITTYGPLVIEDGGVYGISCGGCIVHPVKNAPVQVTLKTGAGQLTITPIYGAADLGLTAGVLKRNTVVDDVTGTLESTDPGEANVKTGTAYKIESASKTGTMPAGAPGMLQI